MLLKEQVVRVRPVDAANLVSVAKARGDQERGLRPRALQDGVDGNGRAVKEKPRRLVVVSRLGNRAVDALNEMTWGGEDLAKGDLAAAGIESRHIGESAADIRSQPKLARTHPTPPGSCPRCSTARPFQLLALS